MSSELHAVQVSNETHPIPWEDRPPGSAATLWRSSLNPIIARDHLPRSNSIFNSAVVSYGSGFAGVPFAEGVGAVEFPIASVT